MQGSLRPRLALGQVLRNRHLLLSSGREVVAMIAVERPPVDARWRELCTELGVSLVWPETVRKELARLT